MAATPYYNSQGRRVPAVTTICRQLGWSTDNLLGWANRVGLEGLTLDQAREPAANIGQIAHAMAEAYIKGETLDTSKVAPELLEPAQRSFGEYKEWHDQNVVEVLACEVPLVSETLQYGGRMDLVFIDRQGRVVMSDLKTGSGLYGDQLVQVAGYGILWGEHHSDRPIERYQLIRVDRDGKGVDFTARTADAMAPAREAFRLCRQLYRLQKEIR